MHGTDAPHPLRRLAVPALLLLCAGTVLALQCVHRQARLCGSAEARVYAYAAQCGISPDAYPQELIALLRRNPETEQFVLQYPFLHAARQNVDLSEYRLGPDVPLFLQWDTRWGYLDYGGKPAAMTACGPTCLAMAAYYLTGDPAMSPDRMIAFSIENGYCVPGSGSSWALISEGGEKLGLRVTELPLEGARLAQCLRSGDPVICAMGPGDFTDGGHFIVLCGWDNGWIRVNDPNSRIRSGRLWAYTRLAKQIRNLWVLELPEA